MKYVALQLVWHAVLNRYVQPGETATFDHLSAEGIRVMVDTGQIAVTASLTPTLARSQDQRTGEGVKKTKEV